MVRYCLDVAAVDRQRNVVSAVAGHAHQAWGLCSPGAPRYETGGPRRLARSVEHRQALTQGAAVFQDSAHAGAARRDLLGDRLDQRSMPLPFR